jgi:WD40 repeat protein
VLLTLLGHEGEVLSIAALPDGATVLTGSADGTAKLWTLDEGHGVPFRTRTEVVGSGPVVASADGTYVVTTREPPERYERPAPVRKAPGLGRVAEVWRVREGATLQSLLDDGRDVTAVVVRPGRDEVLLLSRGGRATLWDLRSGERTKVLSGDMDEATSAAFHPRKPLAAIGCGDGQVWVWDVETGEVLPPLVAHDDAVHTVRFTADGARLLTASRRAAVLWAQDPEWKSVAPLLHEEEDAPAEVFDAVCDPRGRRVATGGADGTVRLWDGVTGTAERVLTHPASAVYRALFSPDGARLVTVGSDPVLRVWDVATGNAVVGVRAHGAAVLDLSYAPSGTALVTASADGTARTWDPRTWRSTRLFSHGGAAVLAARFAPDEATVATVDAAGGVRLWDVRGTAPSRVLTAGSHPADFAFSADGTWGIRSSTLRTQRLVQEVERGADLGAASVFDVRAGRFLFRIEGSAERAPVVAFSSRGDQALVTDGAALATLFDAATWSARPSPLEPADDLLGARFTVDGRHVLGESAGAVLVWDASTGRLRHRLPSAGPEGRMGATSPDARRLLTWDATGRASVWDLETGRRLQSIAHPDAAFAEAGFTADGETLVAAVGGERLQLWSVSSGEEAGRVDREALGAPIVAVAPSPKGDLVAVALEDRSVRVLRVPSREVAFALDGQLARPTDLAFSPDARWIACACADQTIHVWDVASRRETVVFEGHEAPVEWVAFSGGGERLLSGDAAGEVRVWPTDVMGEARARKPRELTEAERRRYLPSGAAAEPGD